MCLQNKHNQTGKAGVIYVLPSKVYKYFRYENYI